MTPICASREIPKKPRRVRPMPHQTQIGWGVAVGPRSTCDLCGEVLRPTSVSKSLVVAGLVFQRRAEAAAYLRELGTDEDNRINQRRVVRVLIEEQVS